MNVYSQNLKKLRKKLGLSVSELSEKINVPSNTLSAYERSARCPSLDFGLLLYKKLDVNLNWFVSGDGNMFKSSNFVDVEEDFEQKVEHILRKKGVI